MRDARLEPRSRRRSGASFHTIVAADLVTAIAGGRPVRDGDQLGARVRPHAGGGHRCSTCSSSTSSSARRVSLLTRNERLVNWRGHRRSRPGWPPTEVGARTRCRRSRRRPNELPARVRHVPRVPASPSSTSSSAAGGGSSCRAARSCSRSSRSCFLGLNYSIDFTGGTLIEYRSRTDVTVRDRSAVSWRRIRTARATAEVQVVGGDQVVDQDLGAHRPAPRRTHAAVRGARRSRRGSARTTSARGGRAHLGAADLATGPDRAGGRAVRDHACTSRSGSSGRWPSARWSRMRARRPDHGRRLRADGPRGHAGDRDRDPDDPRVLAVRHRRDLRQGAGEHRVDRRCSAGTRTRASRTAR